MTNYGPRRARRTDDNHAEMRKVRPIEPPPAGVAIGATEADGVQS